MNTALDQLRGILLPLRFAEDFSKDPIIQRNLRSIYDQIREWEDKYILKIGVDETVGIDDLRFYQKNMNGYLEHRRKMQAGQLGEILLNHAEWKEYDILGGIRRTGTITVLRHNASEITNPGEEGKE